jgi:PHS family inorganic phosphate transporter-like MFS transporter
VLAVTAFVFGITAEEIGGKSVLSLLSGVMALCSAGKLLIPEPKGNTIEQIESGVLYCESVAATDESVSSTQIEAGSGEEKLATTERIREREMA